MQNTQNMQNMRKVVWPLTVHNLPLVPELLLEVEKICRDADQVAMLYELLKHFDGDVGIIIEIQVRDGKVTATHKPNAVQTVVRNYDDRESGQPVRDSDGQVYYEQELL